MKKFIVLRGERKGPLEKDTMVGTLNMVPTALIEKYPDVINKVRCIDSEGKIKEIEVVFLYFVIDFSTYQVKETFNSTDSMSVFAVL